LGFRHERKLKRDEQRAKRKGAARAVVVEMAENFMRLKLLTAQTENDSPMGNMRAHLKMQRRAMDEYLPLLAEEMKSGRAASLRRITVALRPHVTFSKYPSTVETSYEQL
jgi:hypothetical protein